MGKLKIYRGKEFKVCVGDSISENDLFFEEYKKAARMLDEIIEYDGKKDCDNEMEYENNIIGICGERGEGKSSVMLTFVKAVRKYISSDKEGKDVFGEFKNIKYTYFTEPVIIDPSMFDDLHSILDVVLAKLYSKTDKIHKNMQHSDKRNFRYEELIAQFQTVYRYVSLINNQKQSLDDQYDYEGDIGRLSRLGDSTNLKEELTDLVDKYLNFVTDDQGRKDRCRLVIAIDDLDLCSNRVYRMVEEIRKYLIIPNVVIVMALKVEQLEDCLREKNLSDYKASIGRLQTDSKFMDEINMMSEKYANKLIPKARRIYLPKVGSLSHLTIEYVDDWGEEEKVIWSIGERLDIVAAICELIYKKTGMILLPKEAEKDILFPNNLREMVNLIVILLKMKDADAGSEVQYKNMNELEAYFERAWEHMVILLKDREEFRCLHYADVYGVNDNARSIIYSILYEASNRTTPAGTNYLTELDNSFTWVIRAIGEVSFCVSDVYRKARVYRVKMFYTFMMKKMLLEGKADELTRLLGGYVWSGMFSGVLMGVKDTEIDRSRYSIRTQDTYNRILQYVSGREDIHVNLTYGNRGNVSIPKVPGGTDRKYYIYAWILTALFANNYYYNNYQYQFITYGTIVWNNSGTHEFVSISLENYIVALFNLDLIRKKISFEALGVGNEIQGYIDQIEECNKDSIRFMREVVSNMDIVMSILDYCKNHADDKEGSVNETDRTRKLVKKFFENMITYMGQYGVKGKVEDLTQFTLTEGCTIDVCELYALLTDIARSGEVQKDETEHEGERLMLEFREKLRTSPLPNSWDTRDLKASNFLKTTTAENAKKNLEVLAERIQRYIGENQKEPNGFNGEALCDLYGKVLNIYFSDEKGQLSETLRNEYKRMAEIQKQF